MKWRFKLLFICLGAFLWGCWNYKHDPDRWFNGLQEREQAAYICMDAAMAQFDPRKKYRLDTYASKLVPGNLWQTFISVDIEGERDVRDFRCTDQHLDGVWRVVFLDSVY